MNTKDLKILIGLAEILKQPSVETVEDCKVYNGLGFIINSFPDHKGRPGKVGGSLPKNLIDWSKKSNQLKDSKAVNDYIYKLFQANSGSYKTLDSKWEIDLQLDKPKKVRHITYTKEWNKMSNA